MLSKVFSRKRRPFGKNRRYSSARHHNKSRRNFRPHNQTMRAMSSSPKKDAFEFYSNPDVKKMKWIDFVKQIHNRNRQEDANTPLRKSLKDASKLWKKRNV